MVPEIIFGFVVVVAYTEHMEVYRKKSRAKNNHSVSWLPELQYCAERSITKHMKKRNYLWRREKMAQPRKNIYLFNLLSRHSRVSQNRYQTGFWGRQTRSRQDTYLQVQQCTRIKRGESRACLPAHMYEKTEIKYLRKLFLLLRTLK